MKPTPAGASSDLTTHPTTPSRTRLMTRLSVAAVVVGTALRVAVTLTNDTIADELYELVYSRQPVGWIVEWSTHVDPHGPLDYLMRHLFVQDRNVALLRLPSLLFSVATLITMAVWMRHRSWFGVLVVWFSALAPFLVLYGTIARMYSVLILAGTLAAVFAERWSKTGETKWSAYLALVLTLGFLTDNSIGFLAAGAFLVPGLRRDRAAWLWRGAVVFAGLVFVVLLGPTLKYRLEKPAIFAPLTTPESAAVALNGLVTIFYPYLAWIVVLLLGVGAVALWRNHPTLGRVAGALAGVPFLAAMILGIRLQLLIPRTLSFGAWVAPVLLAAFVEAAWKRLDAIGGIAAVAVVLVFMGPSLFQTFQYREGAQASLATMATLVKPGDAVAAYPYHIRYLLAWEFNTDVDAPAYDDPTVKDLYLVRPGDAPPSGRVWVLQDDDLPFDRSGLRPCPGEEVHELDAYTASCFLTPLRRGS